MIKLVFHENCVTLTDILYTMISIVFKNAQVIGNTCNNHVIKRRNMIITIIMIIMKTS